MCVRGGFAALGISTHCQCTPSLYKSPVNGPAPAVGKGLIGLVPASPLNPSNPGTGAARTAGNQSGKPV